MIRSVAPGDLWALRRKSRSQVVLYNESLLVQPHHSFGFALLCLMQGNGRDRSMMVYRDRSVTAVVQAQGRNGWPEQDIINLCVYGPNGNRLPSDYDIWFRLVEQLCVTVGAKHVQRLYAPVGNHQTELQEIFRQLAFQRYTHRIILQLSGPDWDQGTTLAPMRPQSRRDAWAIHKLYGAITPRLVQQAEVRTPRTWMLPLAQRWQKRSCRGWVLGSENNVQAYLHMLSGPSAHVFTLLIHPDERDKATDVLRFGLAQLLDSRPVYLLLREYHQDVLQPMENLGFQPVGEQMLLVKNMTVPVRRSMLLPAFEAQTYDVQVTIPSISAPKEDVNSYVNGTQRNE